MLRRRQAVKRHAVSSSDCCAAGLVCGSVQPGALIAYAASGLLQAVSVSEKLIQMLWWHVKREQASTKDDRVRTAQLRFFLHYFLKLHSCSPQGRIYCTRFRSKFRAAPCLLTGVHRRTSQLRPESRNAREGHLSSMHRRFAPGVAAGLAHFHSHAPG